MKDIKEFFVDNGITQVTIQPEFYIKSMSTEDLPLSNCLMQCQGENCKINVCCPTGTSSKKDVAIVKPSSREKLPGDLELDLKSIRILDNELSNSTPSVKTDSSESQRDSEEKSSQMERVEEKKGEGVKTDEVSVMERPENSDETSVNNK